MNIDRFSIVNISTEQEFIPENVQTDYSSSMVVTGVHYVNYSVKVNGI